LDDLEFDFLPFVERLKALSFNDRKMYEDVFPTRLFDETVALPIVKPLDLPYRHVPPPSCPGIDVTDVLPPSGSS
jgi:hypothetical protein